MFNPSDRWVGIRAYAGIDGTAVVGKVILTTDLSGTSLARGDRSRIRNWCRTVYFPSYVHTSTSTMQVFDFQGYKPSSVAVRVAESQAGVHPEWRRADHE